MFPYNYECDIMFPYNYECDVCIIMYNYESDVCFCIIMSAPYVSVQL